MTYQRQSLGSTWEGFTILPFSNSGFVPEGLGFRMYAHDSLPQERISTLDVGIGHPSREDQGPRRGETIEDSRYRKPWPHCADYIDGDRSFLAACDMVACVLYGYWRLLEKKIQAEGLEKLVDEQEEGFHNDTTRKDSTRLYNKQECHKYISLENLGRHLEIIPEEEFVYDRKEELFFDVTSPGFQRFYRQTIRNLGQANCVRVVLHFGPRQVTFPSEARILLGCHRVMEMAACFPSNTKVDIVLRGELCTYEVGNELFPPHGRWGLSGFKVPPTYLDDLIREVIYDEVSTKELHPITQQFISFLDRKQGGSWPDLLELDWVPYREQVVIDKGRYLGMRPKHAVVIEQIMRENSNVIHPTYVASHHRVGVRLERVSIVDGQTKWD
ncbi:hypothetical protein COCVIDRAFT_21150 [Bipolaris victoriae FI3]|uniref:Uncharacterized protein n=1 Tax=Bipolaris victoriae (strain FI3) TaxID=930091 RepID=W7E9P2_BIPV3|nr:hypothetical protein COCVIDRAFT_21150 [Bipolaris victoriae FI3]